MTKQEEIKMMFRYRKWEIETLDKYAREIIRMTVNDRTSLYRATRAGESLYDSDLVGLRAKIDEADCRTNQKYGRDSDAYEVLNGN